MENDNVAGMEHPLITAFLHIAKGQTAETAIRFLQATGWQLAEAIQLFYAGNETGAVASYSEFPPLVNAKTQIDDSLSGSGKQLDHEHAAPTNDSTVRAPLPVMRDLLYDREMLYHSRRAAFLGYVSNGDRSDVLLPNSSREVKHPGIWEAEQSSASAVDNSRDNLASLYRPPFAIMFRGPFEMAKDAAKDQNRWLLVNLQSMKEFSSHMLNRDTWANEAVAQTIKANFIFWQVNDDTEEGSKVCTYYRLDSPAVLIVDPVTGQKMRSWKGMIPPETLLEDLLPFMDGSPKDHHASFSQKRTTETSQASSLNVQDISEDEYEDMLLSLATGISQYMDITDAEEELRKLKKPACLPLPEKQSRETFQASSQNVQVAADISEEEYENMLLALAAAPESIDDATGGSQDMDTTAAKENICKIKNPAYPPLPEEPKADKDLLCRVGVRLPDGRRLQRNFLRTDRIQLLWSFCNSLLDEEDSRQFRLNLAIPGASRSLEYESNLTFDESGLSDSMISVNWD
ncbi:plant UBX domain-containing protein 7 isoform X2 [Daucus carota subsp. sativus]|uniref:plant UBX domain-containing protein 7 isoform X2 n=1 Tax=Daucus carota subsp. sativus TaxID=79200 RepID=UPI0007EFABCC|nr:PREDICTED: plant UBX domain-containing protein 7-like isoform X2 [Daucus carota subsp. sativus]